MVRDRYVGLLPRPDGRTRSRARCCRCRSRDHRLRRSVLGHGRGGPRRAIRPAPGGRSRWPCSTRCPSSAELDDDTTGTGTARQPDGGSRACPAAPTPGSSPPARGSTVTGRRNDDLRLRLSADAEAWVPVGEARPVGPGGPGARGRRRLRQRDVRARPGDGADSADASACRSGWTRRPVAPRSGLRRHRRRRLDALRRRRFADPADALVAGRAPTRWRSRSTSTRPVWGYRTRWDRTDLLLDIRRPPAIDPGDPLRGRLIAVDPGHPPGGAIGPDRAARGRGQPGGGARAPPAARGGRRQGAHDPHERQPGGAVAPGGSWPSGPTRTSWSRSTTTRCRTASIRS